MIRNAFFFATAGVLAIAGSVVGLMSVAESHSQEPPQTAAAYMESIRGSLPPEQGKPLADGIVTFDEQEAAIAETIGCMREAGLVVQVQPAEGLRRTKFGVRNDLTALADAEIKRLGDDCWAQHLGEVNFVWAHQAPSSSALAAAHDQLQACLAGSGHPLPAVPAGENAVVRLLASDLDDAGNVAVHDCLDRVEVTFGFVP